MAETFTPNVSLSKFDQGDQPPVLSAAKLNANWTKIDALLGKIFDARLQRDDATHVSLQPYQGKYVAVNQDPVDVSAGFSRAATDNRIDGTGADAGAALAVDTLYYVYVSNAKATFSPSSIRLSTVAPTLVAGIKLLGAAGNSLHWRFVGWVRTIDDGGGNANFVDSLTQRLVVNYYNRLRTPMFSCPGYTDDNAVTQYIEATSATWKKINGGVGSDLEYIANGEDSVEFDTSVYLNAVGATDSFSLAVGDNAITAPFAEIDNSFNPGGAPDTNEQLHAHAKFKPSEGYRAAMMLVWVGNVSGNLAIIADEGRGAGVAADTPQSFIQGEIMA